MNCHRCSDVEMVDDGEWFICPCCRCRTRGIERQQARHEQRMADLGMTEEEYDAHCRSLFASEPSGPLPDEMVQRMVKLMAAAWKPACEHDTENPFGPAIVGGGAK